MHLEKRFKGSLYTPVSKGQGASRQVALLSQSESGVTLSSQSRGGKVNPTPELEERTLSLLISGGAEHLMVESEVRLGGLPSDSHVVSGQESEGS